MLNHEKSTTGLKGRLATLERVHHHKLGSPSIFICGHNSRDTRCGIVGPLLQKEFMDRIDQGSKQPQGVLGPSKLVSRDGKISNLRMMHPLLDSTVSLISHIGGHAFAGNVVIYIPKKWKLRGSDNTSPLAGKGIWYGRVEPKHVWGIVEETIQNGRVIEELLRGVHSTKELVKSDEKAGREELSNEMTSDEKSNET